jgi:hypothetical protein
MPQNSILYPVVHAKSNRLLHKCAKNYRITNDSHKDPKIDPLIQFRVGLQITTNTIFQMQFVGPLITPLQTSPYNFTLNKYQTLITPKNVVFASILITPL